MATHDTTSHPAPSIHVVFIAGWELGNWRIGGRCPNSNITLAEFSASIGVMWPPASDDIECYTTAAHDTLRHLAPDLACWLELGCLTNLMVAASHKCRAKAPDLSLPDHEELSRLQSQFATLLVQAGLTPEERQRVVAGVQGLLNHKKRRKGVADLVEAIGAVLGRVEVASPITKLHTSGANGANAEANPNNNLIPATDLRGKIHFALITVREDEHRAVLKRFPTRSTYRAKHRTYSVASIPLADGGQYLVAVVRCIEQGEGHGQDTARDVIEDLDPQWLVLVGIAGGVPSAEFTLGDVVVATRLADYSVRASLEGEPQTYALGGGPMHKQIQDVLALLPAIEDTFGEWNNEASIGVERPLVPLTYNRIYGDRKWKLKVKQSLLHHFKSDERPRRPIITTGCVASGNTLLKDSQTLQQWQQASRHIIAVEMELGGVYIAARRADREYPILAIRGISDIVGYKRHPDWTEYACQSAAAFALAFIESQPMKA